VIRERMLLNASDLAQPTSFHTMFEDMNCMFSGFESVLSQPRDEHSSVSFATSDHVTSCFISHRTNSQTASSSSAILCISSTAQWSLSSQAAYESAPDALASICAQSKMEQHFLCTIFSSSESKTMCRDLFTGRPAKFETSTRELLLGRTSTFSSLHPQSSSESGMCVARDPFSFSFASCRRLALGFDQDPNSHGTSLAFPQGVLGNNRIQISLNLESRLARARFAEDLFGSCHGGNRVAPSWLTGAILAPSPHTVALN
jgi:hypothetical protein